MATFATTVPFATDAADALARVDRRLPAGFATTGRTSVRSERHMLTDVEVTAEPGADVDDCWVTLTSFGLSPSDDLGSSWQTVPGVGC